MKLKKLIAGVLCAALGISLCGCGKVEEISEDITPPVSSAYKTVRLSADGTLDITRKDIGSTPMGEDGTWTIFVYMSGTNLEGMGGRGTEDMEEMLAASTGKNVKFIIQTGGAERWQNDFVSSEKLERYEISNGKREKLAELPLASMAEAATLRSFLKWGVENHPAAKMSVVFWGHGKGSIGGVCKDDLFNGDYLSLEGINNALAEVSNSMTDKFEFIGFDNCYMGTIETADIAASYARYMIGSEELEPAGGWNYTVLGDLLGKEPNADWGKISQTLCDGFFEDSGDSGYANRVTISVTDLSKIDDVIVKFNDYAGELCGALKDKAALSKFEKELESSEHFGDENGFNGYSNMADLGDVAKAGRKFSDKSDGVLSAINNATIYKRLGDEHQNACGLTIYYPFELQGISELRAFGKMAVSPYYLALIDQKQRGISPAADISGYDKAVIAEHWCNDRNNGTEELLNYWGGDPDNGGRNKSAFVRFANEPTFDNGTYSISLDPQTLQNIASVGINIYNSQPDRKYFGLGTKICANANWKTGVFTDEFDGRWFMLPNREPLAIKPRESNGELITYITQVRSHDKETTMLFTHDTKSNAAVIDGLWETNGGIMNFTKPKVGDTLSAFYDLYTYKAVKFSTESGAEYMFDKEPQILYDKLSDGNYYYMVVVTDIWGDRYRSDIVNFSVKNGQLDFEPADGNSSTSSN